MRTIGRLLGIFWATCFIGLALSPVATAQVNSTVGGSVVDAAKALIPGVTITATNIQTGVDSKTLTNESGSYNFPVLAPGPYRLKAELTGFNSKTVSSIDLGAGISFRQNFVLEIATTGTSVNVEISADSLLATSSASIGEVLNADRIANLPLVGNNVLDLVRIMPGYRQGPGGLLGAQLDTFAGTPASQVNTTRDGISVTDGRFINGVYSTTTINPDLVGEVRLILAPVDAEQGRGSAQIQIQTRSGTNKYTGSAAWYVRNTALNPNSWTNNHTIVNGKPNTPNWMNNHEYTAAYGGPIRKNKTFFFVLWDQQIHKERSLVDGGVLTDTARQGIFRYFDGWNPTTFDTAATATPSASTARVAPAVDIFGKPAPPQLNATGTAYSGAGLLCFSVFGSQRIDPNTGGMVPFTAADCPGGSIISSPGSSWDANRPAIDSTGYIFNTLLKSMPHANYFGRPGNGLTPDGLNTASIRWVQGTNGNAGVQTTQGTGEFNNRKQINIKIDHNFNSSHKLSGSYTLERNAADAGLSSWPGGYAGSIDRNPHVLSTNLSSTLSSSLVNEARFGFRYNDTQGRMAFEVHQAELKDILSKITGGADPGYTRATGTVYPALFLPGIVGPSSYSFSGANSLFNTAGSHNGNKSILYTYGDTLSWSRGKHALKFGGEYRPTTSKAYSNVPAFSYPTVQGGSGPILSPIAAGGTSVIAAGGSNVLDTSRTAAANLLYTLSGTIDSVNMLYWMDSYKDVQDGKWQSIATKPDIYRTININEGSFFAKDDWKLTRNLTLNLGLRWEYYANPYILEGFTTTPRDRGTGVFGVGRSTTAGIFDNWLTPSPNPVYLSGYGNTATAADALQCTTGVAQANLPTSSCNATFLTSMDFIGPNSPNPKQTAFKNDLNNFGPAVGFAWQVPWFGGGKTSIRGGFQRTFGGAGRNTSTIGNGSSAVLGSVPGNTSILSGQNALAAAFPSTVPLTIADIPKIVPLAPTSPAVPGGTLPIYNRTATAITGYAGDYVTPYTENYTLSVTTNLHKKLTLDVRYVGTQSRKQEADINLNQSNVYHNQELYDALAAARVGDDSGANGLLLTQMLAGLNLNSGVAGYGTVGSVVSGVYQTGGMHLRRSSTYNTNLINGNFLAVVNSLATTTTPTGFIGTSAILPTPSGRVLRNGCDRIASSGSATYSVGTGPVIPLRCFPENYLFPNPQLTTANYRTNTASSNYHSLETQVTA